MKRKDIVRMISREDARSLGYWPTSKLKSLGVTSRQIAWLESEAILVRRRRGVYTSADASVEVVIAAESHGKISCLTGARMHNLWTPPSIGTHIVVPPGTVGISNCGEVSAHRTRSLTGGVLCSVEECIDHTLRFHDAETGLVLLESALNLGLMSRASADLLTERQANSKQKILGHVSTLAQSGSESRVRLFLQLHRIHVTPQVYIPGVGIVDLLVRRKLVIELDSKAHHLAIEQYHNDRRRDLQSRALELEVIRLTWEQVWLEREWVRTKAMLCRILKVRQKF